MSQIHQRGKYQSISLFTFSNYMFTLCLILYTSRWTPEEHQLFLKGVMLYGREWKKMVPLIKTRTVVQIRTHAQTVFKKDFPTFTLKNSSSTSSSDSVHGTKSNHDGDDDDNEDHDNDQYQYHEEEEEDDDNNDEDEDAAGEEDQDES